MKTKLIVYRIIGVLVLCVTVLGYIMARTMPILGFTIPLGREGVLLFFPVIVAELELYVGFKHVLFSPSGKEHQSKVLGKNVICGFVILGGVLAVWLGAILDYEYNCNNLLPLVGGLIAMMAFRHLCSSIRMCLSPLSKSQKKLTITIGNMLKILGTTMYLILSTLYTIVAILYAGLTSLT